MQKCGNTGARTRGLFCSIGALHASDGMHPKPDGRKGVRYTAMAPMGSDSLMTNHSKRRRYHDVCVKTLDAPQAQVGDRQCACALHELAAASCCWICCMRQGRTVSHRNERRVARSVIVRPAMPLASSGQGHKSQAAVSPLASLHRAVGCAMPCASSIRCKPFQPPPPPPSSPCITQRPTYSAADAIPLPTSAAIRENSADICLFRSTR